MSHLWWGLQEGEGEGGVTNNNTLTCRIIHGRVKGSNQVVVFSFKKSDHRTMSDSLDGVVNGPGLN